MQVSVLEHLQHGLLFLNCHDSLGKPPKLDPDGFLFGGAGAGVMEVSRSGPQAPGL